MFRSPDLLVVHVGGFGRDICVVTFTSFTDTQTLERDGFGESFLQSRRTDAIHVISRGNDWFQYAEMEAALACVRNAAAAYARVMTYGASMGGYAAIRLAGLAGAHCALALSPQYSILPNTVRFEYRWPEAGRRLRPVWEGTLPLPALPAAFIVYDPLNMDAQHAELFAAAGFRFTAIRLRNAGHQVAGSCWRAACCRMSYSRPAAAPWMVRRLSRTRGAADTWHRSTGWRWRSACGRRPGAWRWCVAQQPLRQATPPS